MFIVLSCLDVEATVSLSVLCTHSSSCIMTQTHRTIYVSYLAATHACLGAFGYRYYVMLFLGSYCMPYKRHDNIVDVVCYT